MTTDIGRLERGNKRAFGYAQMMEGSVDRYGWLWLVMVKSFI